MLQKNTQHWKIFIFVLLCLQCINEDIENSSFTQLAIEFHLIDWLAHVSTAILFSLEPSNGISRTECIIWVIWYACLTHVLICVYHACSYMRISCALWYARFMRIPMRLFLRALTSNKMKHFLRKFTQVYFKFQKYAFLAFEMCINNTH